MRKVRQIQIERGMSVDQLMRQYSRAGVLGAGALGKACDILEDMVKARATIFLGLAGPLVAAGMRNMVTELINLGAVSAIVTNGANVVHDVLEALGGAHYVGSFHEDDRVLHQEELGRIGNVYTRVKDFTAFEDYAQELLSGISEERRRNLSVRELTSEIGKSLRDEGSFLRAAYEQDIPVFSPAVVDSMLGLQLFFFAERHSIVLNALKDMKELAQMVFDAPRVGALFLGGGVPKHYILGANLLRGGIDYGIQVTLDREEGGSLSGAKLEEGISWGKTKEEGRVVSVVGDATVIFPLLVASLKERLGGEQ
ncbi:deoxyhypusine synthase [Candidatus Pyrohabitans sp.]